MAKVFHPYGSKERLFEMVNRVNRLDEEVLPMEKKNEIIEKFIREVCDYLGIDSNNLDLEISYDPTEAAKMASFGINNPETGKNRVVAANRNLADVLRTLAHELVHEKQKIEGRLYDGGGADGTDLENEANAEAAVIMRKFGRANPIIFE